MPIKGTGSAMKARGRLDPIDEEKPMLALPMSEGAEKIMARAVVALPKSTNH